MKIEIELNRKFFDDCMFHGIMILVVGGVLLAMAAAAGSGLIMLMMIFGFGMAEMMGIDLPANFGGQCLAVLISALAAIAGAFVVFLAGLPITLWRNQERKTC